MNKILYVCHTLPHPAVASSLRSYHFIKLLAARFGYRISLLSLVEGKTGLQYSDVGQHCEYVETFTIPKETVSPASVLNIIANSVAENLVVKGDPSFVSRRTSLRMSIRIARLVENARFDLALADDLSSAFFLLGCKIPKLVDVKDALLARRKTGVWRDNQIRDRFGRMRYWRRLMWESRVYRDHFESWIVASQNDKTTLASYLVNQNIEVIPSGVDTTYFSPCGTESKEPSVLFLGHMSSSHNESAVLYFFERILPLLRKRVPNLTTYVVGRNPSRKVLNLSSQQGVVVTGEVTDVRPYLARAWVVINPMVRVVGMLNKVLESMSMGKAVVSSVSGVQGLDVENGTDLLVATSPSMFAQRVLELINNGEKRNRIGECARELVCSKYSWASSALELHNIIQRYI